MDVPLQPVDHRVAWSRSFWAAAEPFTLSMMFSREIRAEIVALGLPSSATFFAVRGAPLGRADSAVVTAAFHGLPHGYVAQTWDSLWKDASPSAVIRVHGESVPLTAARTLNGTVDTDRLRQLADVLTAVVADLDTAGRPLAAANQAVDAPAEPWARFWRACNTLREYRGDGHIAVLLGADLDAREALTLTAIWGADHIDTEMLRASRQLTDEVWGAAVQRLARRGVLDESGALTSSGRALRDGIETRTDELAARPWQDVSEDERADLLSFLTDVGVRLIEAGHMRARTAVGAPWPPPV
ncbi:SCO6745 family protein [Jatrophihabitans sp. DSM 45814]